MISARIHYATLALIELAIRRDSRQPVAVREISEKHRIPGPFLVQILRTLRGAGWVQSVRGSQGGYRLLADPNELSLLEIADVVGCQESGLQSFSTDTRADQLLQEAWAKAAEASRGVLKQKTLGELAAQATQGEAVMFYI